MAKLGPYGRVMLELLEDPAGHPRGCVVKIMAERNRLEQARLYGEKLIRDRDELVRKIGADLLQILDDQA